MTTQASGAALVAVSQTREQVHELMRSYLERISLDVSPLAGKIVHIAGEAAWRSLRWKHPFALSLFEQTERKLRMRYSPRAGTKGKGSTSSMCESILRHQGLKTGAFVNKQAVAPEKRCWPFVMPWRGSLFKMGFLLWGDTVAMHVTPARVDFRRMSILKVVVSFMSVTHLSPF